MNIINTLKTFWKIITLKRSLGGLEISDSAIKYVALQNGVPVSYGVRLLPGVVKVGRIMDVDQFSEALRTLHNLIVPGKVKESVRVIVALPADLVYTQSFSVPNVDQEKMQESIKLNLQMLSPVNAENAYMSSQILQEADDHIDALGAFAEKEKIEAIRSVLIAARFAPVLFEFPALALSRLMNISLGAGGEAVLLIQISSDGLDVLIYRNNSLYFDYFRSWQSIQGESREISKSVFEEVITIETQKVINFSLSRFKEAPKKAFIIAPGYEVAVKEILERSFNMQAVPFKISSYALGPSWYVPLGSAVRALGAYEKDTAIALGVGSFFDVFYEENIINIIHTWRNVAFGAVLSFIVIFGTSLSFLNNQAHILESRLGLEVAQLPQGDFTNLASKVKEFNALVTGVRAVRDAEKPWLALITEFKRLTDTNQISIDRFDASDFSAPITLGAHGPDHASVIKFKNLLSADPRFFNVDLPLSRITVLGDNSVSFTLTLKVREPFISR